MTRKSVIGLIALTLSLAGGTGLTGAYRGWFSSAEKPAVSTSECDKEAAAAAARHCRCQPRHWRYLMLQTQQ